MYMVRRNVTLSLNSEIYEDYRGFCKRNAIALSKSIEQFMNNRLSNSNNLIKPITETSSEQVLNSELLGLSFENSLDKTSKKASGQFYTPIHIVRYVLDYLNIQPDSKILDMSCGCGIFLSTYFEMYSKRFSEEKTLSNLYGVDLNPTATNLAQFSVWLKTSKKEDYLKILRKNIQLGNSIVSNKKIDGSAFKWDKFGDVFSQGGFDFIIGNPPYVVLQKSDFDAQDTSYQEVINGNVNAATLMIRKAYDLLKNNGVLAFVLPKSLVRVNSYNRLRDFLLKHTQILHIFDLGQMFKDVRGEQIILIIRKQKDRTKIEENKILIKYFEDKEKDLSSQPEINVSQTMFNELDSFLLFESKEHYELILKLTNNFDTLSTIPNCQIFRGISVTKKALEDKEGIPVIKGESIDKFSIKKYAKASGINLDSEKARKLRSKKIVLQNIFSSESGIKATLDDMGTLSVDTVTNILVDEPNLKYVLALLNSKIVNFFIIYNLYNKSRLTMHTDRKYLEKIPIPKISYDTKHKICIIVDRLLSITDEDHRIKLMKELNNEIFSIYSLSTREINLIDNSLRSIMSNRSYVR